MISTHEPRQADNIWDRITAPTERYRRPFRKWRRGRPFYAGLSIMLGGLDIWYWPHSSVGKMISMGLPGISSLFIAIFMLLFGLTIWFYPTYRFFSGVASILLALLSLVATNLGGFLFGFLLGMFGGAFAIAWTPRTDYTEQTRRQRRHEEQPAGASTMAFQGDAGAAAESAPGSEYEQNTAVIDRAASANEAAQAQARPTPEED